MRNIMEKSTILIFKKHYQYIIWLNGQRLYFPYRSGIFDDCMMYTKRIIIIINCTLVVCYKW